MAQSTQQYKHTESKDFKTVVKMTDETWTHTHTKVLYYWSIKDRTKCNTADAETDREMYHFAADKETDREIYHFAVDKEDRQGDIPFCSRQRDRQGDVPFCGGQRDRQGDVPLCGRQRDWNMHHFAADRETDRKDIHFVVDKETERGDVPFHAPATVGGGSGPLCSARMRRHLPRHTSDCTNSNMPAPDHQQPQSTHQFMNCVPFQGKKLSYQINEINAPFNEFWLNTDLSAVTVLVQWDWCNFYELWLMWLKTMQSLSLSCHCVSSVRLIHLLWILAHLA